MGAALSISAVDALARAIKNHAPQRCLTVPHHGTADWSGLPEDLLLTIMAELDVPNIIRSGAVCTSWHYAYKAFRRLRLPSPKQAPCLLYACDEYGPNIATMYYPSSNATFRVPFPRPPDESQGFVSSCHGWVFATDESGDPYLLNPITGSQAALPSSMTIYHGESRYDHDHKRALKDRLENRSLAPIITWAWHSGYICVAISAATEIAACTVVIVHTPNEWRLSFARPGDKQWTLLPSDQGSIDVLYNDKDGLFYALGCGSSVYTLDLNGPLPMVTMIMRGVSAWGNPTKYLAFSPSGELQQVWRIWNCADVPIKDMVDEGGVDFANEYDDDKFSELFEEYYKFTTVKLFIFKVDTGRQKLVELRDIGDHALFLGYNNVVYVPTKDFPAFKPNRAYLTDDRFKCKPTLKEDLGIWNVKERNMQKLQDAWPCMYSWLDLPAPIWITPRF
ncbi:hypothetical protein VPH35_092092 [Triticum aestivum]